MTKLWLAVLAGILSLGMAPPKPATIDALMEAHGITIEWVDHFTVPNAAVKWGESTRRGVIKIRVGRDEVRTNATILHEIAHEVTDGEHDQAFCDQFLAYLADYLPERLVAESQRVHLAYGCDAPEKEVTE